MRELYREPQRTYELLRGFIEPGAELTIASKMGQGELYVDGARTLYAFPFGTRARITLAAAPLRIFRHT